MVLNNLKIGNNTALWIVLFLTLLVATLPILKIQYCAPTYSYTRSDVTQCILGLFILVGVATIAISDQLFFRYWLQQKTLDSTHIHKMMPSNALQMFNIYIRSCSWKSLTQNDATSDVYLNR